MNLKPIENIFPTEYLGKWCIAQYVGTHGSFDQMYVETTSGNPVIRLFDSEKEGLTHLRDELKIESPYFNVMQVKQIDSEKKSVYPELPCFFLGLKEK